MNIWKQSSQVGGLRRFVLLQSQVRCLFLTANKDKSTQTKEKIKILSEPPADRTTDYIGPPHPTSNIRPVQFHIPVDETPTEKEFRERRAALLDWNQHFWAEHNHRFFKEKSEFVKQHKKENEGGGKDSLSPKEMSIFYKTFLDSNRASLLRYNKEWYKKNIALLWPAMKIVGIKFRRSLSQNKTRS